MDLDEVFLRSYLNDYSEKEKNKILLSQDDREIAEQKREQLTVIRDFLQKFVDLEVVVHHCLQYSKNTTSLQGVEPQPFSFYEVDSSKSWAPGISIWFNHPAEIEIAIPNRVHEDGVVVINVSTHHPDAYILEQPFTSYQSACEALGKFLGKCTHSIGKDSRSYIKEVTSKAKHAEQHKHHEQHNTGFVQNVPKVHPEEHHSNVKNSFDKDTLEGGLSLKKISDLFTTKNKIKDE